MTAVAKRMGTTAPLAFVAWSALCAAAFELPGSFGGGAGARSVIVGSVRVTILVLLFASSLRAVFFGVRFMEPILVLAFVTARLGQSIPLRLWNVSAVTLSLGALWACALWLAHERQALEDDVRPLGRSLVRLEQLISVLLLVHALVFFTRAAWRVMS